MRVALLAAVLLLGGTHALWSQTGSDPGAVNGPNVLMVDGKQVIFIAARGGYSPRTTVAKADVPTVLNVVTKSTFDCSLALMVPKIGYQAQLPVSGTTRIEVPPQKPGTTLQGHCSMAMYHFSITFN